jgi:hypothetical protein
MHFPRGQRRLLTLLAIAPFAVASGAARADAALDAPVEAAPAAPAQVESPVVLTSVQPTQSCGGEWSIQALSSQADGTVLALIGTDEDYEIGIAPDGVTVSRLSNCTLTVSATIAAGLSYAVTKISYEGRALLDEGVVAEQGVSYAFVGGRSAPRVSQRLTGPYEGGTALDLPFPESGLVWSRCEAPEPLQIRTSLYLENAQTPGSGFLSMSLTSGVLMLVLELATRPCSAGS